MPWSRFDARGVQGAIRTPHAADDHRLAGTQIRDPQSGNTLRYVDQGTGHTHTPAEDIDLFHRAHELTQYPHLLGMNAATLQTGLDIHDLTDGQGAGGGLHAVDMHRGCRRILHFETIHTDTAEAGDHTANTQGLVWTAGPAQAIAAVPGSAQTIVQAGQGTTGSTDTIAGYQPRATQTFFPVATRVTGPTQTVVDRCQAGQGTDIARGSCTIDQQGPERQAADQDATTPDPSPEMSPGSRQPAESGENSARYKR